MLVLSRKEGESFQVGEATITIVRLAGGNVRVGIAAPKTIPIRRTELEPLQSLLAAGPAAAPLLASA